MAFDMWSVSYICHDCVRGNLETEMIDKDYINFVNIRGMTRVSDDRRTKPHTWHDTCT
jgi:hypothetical protein